MRMFAVAAAALAVLLASPADAQHHRGPDTAAQRAAIERLSPLMGRWHGVAQVFTPTEGTVHQTEQVERVLDGLVLIIQGTGHSTAARTGEPVFRAFAVISYDTRASQYEVRAYTHEGYVTTAAAGELLDDGSFRWGFAPGGTVQVRFTIAFDETTWRERGEMSYDDGVTWVPTVELNLRRAD